MLLPYIKSCPVTNFFKVGDRIVIEGIAADTSRDIAGDMASKEFISVLSTTLLNKPMYYNHNYGLPPIGRILETRVVDDGNKLWIKGELYPWDPAINEGVLNGSMRWLSVGAMGRTVDSKVLDGRPTKIYRDGYGQEVTLTGVPVNPTAFFRISKSLGWVGAGYNSDEDDWESYSRVYQQLYNADPRVVRDRAYQNLQSFSKGVNMGNEAIMNQQYLSEENRANSINPNAAVPRAQKFSFPEGGQLTPQGMEQMIQKAMSISDDPQEFRQNLAALLHFQYLKTISGKSDTLNGGNRGVADGGWPSDVGQGTFAREIPSGSDILAAQMKAGYLGVQPDDQKALEKNLPTGSVDYYGNDEKSYLVKGAKTPKSEPGVVGSSGNSGVQPGDRDFMEKGMELPPIAKSNGKYPSGSDVTIRKAQDLAMDPVFLKAIHHSPYVGLKRQGEEETHVEYLHRLIHERGTTDADSPFRKALESEAITALNLVEYQHGTIEDNGILEHILSEPREEEVLREFVNNPSCWYSKSWQEKNAELINQNGSEFQKGCPPMKDEDDDKGGKSQPPWLKNAKEDDKDEDEKKDKKDKKDDDKDEDDEKKKKGNPFAKKDDGDKDEDDKAQDFFKKAFDQNELGAALSMAARDAIMQGQQDSLNHGYVKGLTGGPATAQPQAQTQFRDGFEQAIFNTLRTGQPSYGGK